MKVACVLLVCLGLFSAGQADVSFDTDALKDLGNSVLTQLLDKAKDVGTELLKSAAEKLLGNLSGLIGKRDLSVLSDLASDLTSKLEALANKGKEMAGSAFADALEKLKALTKKYQAAIGTIKDAAGIKSHIDSVVAEHSSRQKRVIEKLTQAGKQLLAGLADKVKGLAGKVKDAASEAVSKALQVGVNVAGDLGLFDKLGGILGKRGLTENLQKISGLLDGVLGPLNSAVGGLGETLKGHFSNLVDTVQGHADALQTKLAPHIEKLKGHGKQLVDHGKNALAALSEVVGDILNQTKENMGDSFSGVSKTISDAGKTVADHFSGADSKMVADF